MTILANARLILADTVLRGAVSLSDGTIAEILPGDRVPPGALDMGGDYLAPGLVELHTDNLERCFEPRPKVRWPADAAILAHDGQDGIDKARITNPDIILLDMNLPVVDGWTAARTIRADASLPRMPIIALTAHAMSGDREKTIAAGCDDYHAKPVDFARLLGQIEALVEKEGSAEPVA